jgi:hypothetical protein
MFLTVGNFYWELLVGSSFRDSPAHNNNSHGQKYTQEN